jgi:uncharacterized protein (TIGR00299 family) protein
MRIAYLDTFAGISGDMFLAALVDAGLPASLLHETLNALGLGARLEVRQVHRSGIEALKANVLVGDVLAETVSVNGHANGHFHSHPHEDHHEHNHVFDLQPKAHEASVHRFFSSIRTLIHESELPFPVADLAVRTFEELTRAESKIHGIPLDEVHFHEVGAVDAIADIVLVAAGVHALKIEAWHCSPVNVGGGTVECAHGRYPVPAPATAELLRGVPTYSSGIQMELITPTGAALLRALQCQFGPAPAMRVDRIGYGAGNRDPKGFANVLRLSVGESEFSRSIQGDSVTVIETAVDDLNPQIVAYVAEKALQLGALDVMCVPVQMKKNRQGTLITVLASSDKAVLLQDLLLRETSSLGVRVREERRICLAREWKTVETMWGPVRIKVARREGEEWNAAPEYEDCRNIAQKHSVPLKDVFASAMQIYRAGD